MSIVCNACGKSNPDLCGRVRCRHPSVIMLRDMGMDATEVPPPAPATPQPSKFEQQFEQIFGKVDD